MRWWDTLPSELLPVGSIGFLLRTSFVLLERTSVPGIFYAR